MEKVDFFNLFCFILLSIKLTKILTGTPLQFLNGQRDKSSTGLLAKTLGSSIKKHIFHKNFLSKTPKRSGTPAIQVGLIMILTLNAHFIL